MKLHTFVVLAYKESNYLEECIQSVLNQTYSSEVLIATTTNNNFIQKIAKKYKLKIVEGKHTSIGGDFDFAIKAAKTPLVTIAHQDDIYDPTYAEEIVEAYQKKKESIILFTDCYEIRNYKKVYKNTNLRIKRILITPLRFSFLTSKKWVKRFVIRFGNAICCPAVTFQKEKLNFPVFEYNMTCDIDWHAWETLSKQKGDFIFISKCLMGHRVHEESETTKTINANHRTKEDLEIFKRFWPEWFAKRLNHFYSKSEKSNKISS